MKLLVFHGIGLLFLFSVFRYFPMGIERKTRFRIAISAFFLSLLGTSAASHYAYWQIGLFLLLLSLLTAYLITKRQIPVEQVIDEEFVKESIKEEPDDRKKQELPKIG